MKLALVANTWWNIANFRMGLVRAFQEKGVKVYVLGKPDAAGPLLEKNGCTLVPMPISRDGTNLMDELRLYMFLKRWYKENEPDLACHFTIKPNIYGTLAASRTGVPCINNITGIGSVFISESILTPIIRFMYRHFMKHATRVFFQNTSDRDLFLEHGMVSPEQWKMIPGSGVDIDHFSPDVVPPALDDVPPVFRFLYVGRFLREKGLVELLEAAEALSRSYGPEFELVLVGSRDDNPSTLSQEDLDYWKTKPWLRLVDFQSDPRPWYALAQVVVLPSYREGVSRTLLEAGAMGKPLLVTDVPGCRETVSGTSNGLLCKPKDSLSLKDAMEKYLAMSAETLNAMGMASRSFIVENFDQRIVIKSYLEEVSNIRGGD